MGTEHQSENTVLIINDTPDQLEMMSLSLAHAGYRVFTAHNGYEGFQTVQREHPDLVVSDVAMPQVDGIELCRLIRADAEIHTTPILLVSALRRDTASVVEGLQAGADDYLEAPYDAVRLTAKVARLVERALAERALRESEERFRLLVEGAKDHAIFMLDTAGRITSWNEGAERVEGYRVEEILGQHFSCFYLTEDSNGPKPQRALETAEVEGWFEDEGWRVRKDGTRFWASVVITALKDVAGRLRGFSNVTRDITERKEALRDALTGLPNRAWFIDHLKRTIARGKRHEDYLFAVLFLDLDRFKLVNDSFGHVIADQLLVAIARKLELCVRPEDIVARLGGDEFTILLEDIKDTSDATRVAERIHKELTPPFNLDGHEVFTTASIGITLSSQYYEQPEDCLRDADTAMYRAKILGKARHEIFDQSMHAHVVALLKLETDLRMALERHEFQIQYQPIVLLRTGRITGFEALARWQHPHRGPISPAEFIPVAEENGLIIPIGIWILHEACRQMFTWQTQFPVNPPLEISVNLSRKQFAQPDLIERISDTLQETGLDARSLNLEITESVVMENAAASTALLLKLRDRGIKLHIDDFGTGYSSLSYLHSFPADTLKIDRSFVTHIDAKGGDAEIVRAIVTLAHNLKMQVMAEGVETAEQLTQLRGLECEYGQGFFFSGAVDAEAVAALLESNFII